MPSQEIFVRAAASAGDFAPMPKTLLVFAHPGDETLGLGARLARFQAAHLVHVTDGAPGDEEESRKLGFRSLREYRQARAKELNDALNLAGVGAISRDCLGIPEREASLHLPWLARQIFRFLLEREPEAIFTHPYEGGHPDHDACAFAVRSAVEHWKFQHKQIPVIIEAAFYHAGPDGIEAGAFLPAPTASHLSFELSKAERLRKKPLLECFKTQQESLRDFPLLCEQYRIAPEYDFSRPPHPAPAWYDRFGWSIAAAEFCNRARHAEESLQEELAEA